MVISDRTQDAPQRGTGRRKVGAILAGGLVLGVGAAVTLAAWNDSEFASGIFGSGTFNLQGSVDGDAWDDHASTGTAASLSFSQNFDELKPGDVVYAPYALQIDGDYDASLVATAPVVTGALAGGLAFDAVSTGTFGCDAAAFDGGSAVPGTMTPDTPVYLCLQVTAASDIDQNETATAVWQWTATAQ